MNKKLFLGCVLVSCFALAAQADYPYYDKQHYGKQNHGNQKHSKQYNRYKNNHPAAYKQRDETGNYFYDFAKVRSVTPIIETVTNHVPLSCNHRTHYQPAAATSNNATPMILGTIIGAAIGNKLGHKKSNQRVGAVAGGILGASIGSNIGNDMADRSQQHRCQPRYETHYQEQVVGYNVEYRYRGKTYHTRTSEHPGKRIQMKLHFEPALS